MTHFEKSYSINTLACKTSLFLVTKSIKIIIIVVTYIPCRRRLHPRTVLQRRGRRRRKSWSGRCVVTRRTPTTSREIWVRVYNYIFPLVGLFFLCVYENLILSLFLSPSSVDKKAERRKDATEKVAKLTSTLVSGINRGVLEVFENQKQVEKEAKNLQKKVDAFKEQSAQWVKSLETFDESLKSIGDFENYVMTLEKELSDIAEELKKSKT